MSDATCLRLGVPGDAVAIRDLTRAAYATWVPVIGRPPKPMAADDAVALTRHRFDLLYVGAVLAGLVETVLLDAHTLIENWVVSPAFQNRGLGRRLLDFTEQRAARLGHADIRLYTSKMFRENIALHARRGYVVQRKEALAAGVVVHMAKRLSVASSAWSGCAA